MLSEQKPAEDPVPMKDSYPDPLGPSGPQAGRHHQSRRQARWVQSRDNRVPEMGPLAPPSRGKPKDWSSGEPSSLPGLNAPGKGTW